MKDLLNNGFQPVTETEMVMVEGGRLTPPCTEINFTKNCR